MLTIVILDNGERKVTSYTYDAIWREIKDIPDVQLLVEKDWFAALDKTTNKLVSFVEADCLISSGYYQSLMGYIKKHHSELNKMAVMSGSTAVGNWAVRFYGYNIGNAQTDQVVPNMLRKATQRPFYTTQIAYIPGSIMRTNFLKQIVESLKPNETWKNDLVYLSAQLSVAFWERKWMVYLAPNPVYCTTETYVNDIAVFPMDMGLQEKFHRESI